VTAPRKRTKQRTIFCRDCQAELGVMSLDGRRVRVASNVSMVWLADRSLSALRCPECGCVYQLHRASALYITLEAAG